MLLLLSYRGEEVLKKLSPWLRSGQLGNHWARFKHRFVGLPRHMLTANISEKMDSIGMHFSLPLGRKRHHEYCHLVSVIIMTSSFVWLLLRFWKSFHMHFLFGSLHNPVRELGKGKMMRILTAPSITDRYQSILEKLQYKPIGESHFCMINIQGTLSDWLCMRQPRHMGSMLFGYVVSCKRVLSSVLRRPRDLAACPHSCR